MAGQINLEEMLAQLFGGGMAGGAGGMPGGAFGGFSGMSEQQRRYQQRQQQQQQQQQQQADVVPSGSAVVLVSLRSAPQLNGAPKNLNTRLLPFDADASKKLLAEAGYPNGFSRDIEMLLMPWPGRAWAGVLPPTWPAAAWRRAPWRPPPGPRPPPVGEV